MKKAFTLVERLVVIAIIGILSGVLLASFGGSRESARAAQCLSNMKNLATACLPQSVDSDKSSKGTKAYPLHKPRYNMGATGSGASRRAAYLPVQGWVSYDDKGKLDAYGCVSSKNLKPIGFRTSDRDLAVHAVTNGYIWPFMGGNRASYVCPSHAQACGEHQPAWSYLMSGRFTTQIPYGSFPSADKVLMFSEIPFKPWHSWLPEGTGTGTDDDCGLQYVRPAGAAAGGSNPPDYGTETIGANHMVGKTLYAHVAFADGHCEKLVIPFSGSAKKPTIDDNLLKDLTGWLCEGFDVSFDGKTYQKIDE